MSWSIKLQGRVEALPAAVDKAFANMTVCNEPEEAIKQLAHAAIQQALTGFAPYSAVDIYAGGSQWTEDGKSKSSPFCIEVKGMGIFLG